tara:strand:+ start:9714 stop:11639 length:1926 start_codon:yes stop_codon:yes gene_type:complete
MANDCNLDKRQVKDIKYLNKDFSGFRNDLIKFAKSYFPETYNDFNESSPGMMFIEMASYVGDSLSYYVDDQLKESMLMHAEERANVVDLARALGYKTNASVPSLAEISVYQIVPAIFPGGGVVKPDMRYAMEVAEGMVLSGGDSEFITQDKVDFKASSSANPTEISVYQIDDTTGEPTYYLLKKEVSAMAGKIETEEFVFTDPKKFDKITLAKDDVVAIVDCRDSDGNKWYEVDYLAQDNIFEDVINNWTSDPSMSAYNYDAPYILKLRRTARRFTTHTKANNMTQLWFGSGVSSQPDEVIVPSPSNVGLALPYGNTTQNYMNGTTYVDIAFDPANTMFTRQYGEAPRDTTLTIKYIAGGGIISNVAARTIDTIIESSVFLEEDGLPSSTVKTVKESLATINLKPAVGGRSAETTDDIKYNALAHFASQNRAVTREDYIARIYAMPAKFGSIAKAYLDKDEQYWIQTVGTHEIKNPLAINLYALAYNDNKNYVPLTPLAKKNMQTYLSQYRMLTDAINIKDAHIINIGVDFGVLPRPGYQNKDVLLRCIKKLRCIFDPDNWSINEPIILPKIATELDKVEGVQTVKSLRIFNLFDRESGYSGNIYDIKGATRDGVVYPSMDPCIFEVKNLDTDIKGRIVGY